MARRRALTAEEGDELKNTLEFLAQDISAIKQQQKVILELVEEVKALRIAKDRRLAELETRVAELEQSARMNGVIVTGLRIKPRSYARAVTTNNSGDPGEDQEQDESSVEQQVANFLHSRGINMEVNNIEGCPHLPRRNDNNTPVVVIRLANKKPKISLLKQGRKLKGSNVYINDHLTKRNADIARKARSLRKEGKIQSTWTNIKMQNIH